MNVLDCLKTRTTHASQAAQCLTQCLNCFAILVIERTDTHLLSNENNNNSSSYGENQQHDNSNSLSLNLRSKDMKGLIERLFVRTQTHNLLLVRNVLKR